MKKDLLHFFPLLLLIVIISAYGLLIPWLGFYLDDWYIIWFRHFFGSAAFSNFFGQDRPFLAWIYIILTPILGDSPIGWQTFAVFTRWLLGLAAWDLFKQIWPERKVEPALGALLFSIFPGFQFHWFSVQYSQAYLVMAGMLFSLACSLRGIRRPENSLHWLLLGWLPGVYGLISIEYHFGLELLRPVLIWLALAGRHLQFGPRLKRTLWHWLPYLVPLLAFLIWRVFFFQSFMYEITLLDDLSANPALTLLKLMGTVLNEMAASLLFVWGKLFQPAAYNLTGKILYLVAAVFLVMIFTLFFYLRSIHKRTALPPNNWRWGLGTALLGIITAVLCIIPFKAAGLPVNLEYPWNRFMIVMGLGSAIFAVGLLSLLPRRWMWAAASAILLSLSIASQVNTANQFRLAWEDQKKLFWQITWRMPGLQPGTMLVTDHLPTVRYYSGTSLSAPLNWIYAPNLASRNTPYQLVQLDTPQVDTSHTLQPHTPVNIEYRSFQFSGNTDQSVFFTFNSTDCLQVLSDSGTSRRMLTAYHDQLFLEAISISNLSQIISSPDVSVRPPNALFGDEPLHNWCYYYLKADLARQQGDWVSVLDWYDQADQQGYSSLQDTEMYPKIEALAMTDNWAAARHLTEELLNGDPFLNRGLCAIWERSVENNPPQGADRTTAAELIDPLNCPELEEVLR